MRADLGNADIGAPAIDRLDANPLGDDPLAGEGPAAGKARTTGKADSAATGYCLWEFDGAAWILKKDRSHRGHVPSPPSISGRFRGHLRAVMSVPAAAIVGEQAMVVPDTQT